MPTITVTPLNTILSWFQTDDFPTELQFANSWSSFWHKNDKLPISSIEGLTQMFQQTASSEAFNNHLTDSNAHSGFLAKLDATNLNTSNVNAWRSRLGVQDIPANVGLVDNGGSQYVYNKSQVDSIINDSKKEYYNKISGGSPEVANGIIERYSIHSKKLLSYIETQLNHNGDLISDLDVTGDGFYIKENGKYYVQIFDAVIDVRDIGMLPGQNCGAIFQRNLERLKKTGAAFIFPAAEGDYIFETQILFPYTVEVNTPTQRPWSILGNGAYANGKEIGGNGKRGSTIQLAYNGDGTYLDAKIITRGLGNLVIEDITLQDISGDNTPFIYAIYTTLRLSRNAFLGDQNKVGSACDQDVIFLGGKDATEIGDNPNGGFQGYGTVIQGNYFNHIRRGLVGQNYCNGIIFNNNIFWFQCGNANGGCIKLDGSTSLQTCTGNVFAFNLVEMLNYKHFFEGYDANNNSFISNNLFDAHSATTAYYKFVNSEYNYILHGFHNDSAMDNGALIPTITGNTTQTEITAHQGQFSRIEKLISDEIVVSNGSAVFNSAKMKDQNSDIALFNRYFKANKEYVTVRQNNDGSETDLYMIKDFGDNYFGYNFKGVDPRLDSEENMKIRCGSGKELYIGDKSNKGILLLNGGIRFVRQEPDQVINNSLFLDINTGKLSFKDDTGTVHAFY
ncbi:MAG: hypothetical protein JNN23_04895 [Chryseobacterium gambrini]|nr:hypothetical protein [Chryseobacterium gambrini]